MHRQVYKAVRRSVLPVAVKVVSGAVAQTEDAQLEFLREVAYLRSLLSPNIVQFQVPLSILTSTPSATSKAHASRQHMLAGERCVNCI